MGQQNSSYRSLILPVLENLFQRTLFLASKIQITKSSTSSAVRVFSKVWCLHYHMTREVIYLGYNTAVCWKINFTHVSTKIYILIHQLHQILIPNASVKGHLNQNSKQIIYAHLKVFVCGLIFLGSIDQCVSFLWFIHFFVLCFFHVLLSMCSIFVREKCFYMLSLPPGSQFFFWAHDGSWVKSSGLLSTFFFLSIFFNFLGPVSTKPRIQDRKHAHFLNLIK